MILPLLVLLVLGALDVGRAIQVRHNLVEAARAGCRLYAVLGEVSEGEAEDAVDQVMEEAGLANYTVEFDPATREFDHLDPVTVTVTIPFSEASWFRSWFLDGRALVGACTMPADVSSTE